MRRVRVVSLDPRSLPRLSDRTARRYATGAQKYIVVKQFLFDLLDRYRQIVHRYFVLQRIFRSLTRVY